MKIRLPCIHVNFVFVISILWILFHLVHFCTWFFILPSQNICPTRFKLFYPKMIVWNQHVYIFYWWRICLAHHICLEKNSISTKSINIWTPTIIFGQNTLESRSIILGWREYLIKSDLPRHVHRSLWKLKFHIGSKVKTNILTQLKRDQHQCRLTP